MDITELLDKCINTELVDLTISGKRKKTDTSAPDKVKIRPVIIKEEICYQVSEFIGPKVFHRNCSDNEVKKVIISYLENDFKQAQFVLTDAQATVLAGNKSNFTCKYKKAKEVKAARDLSHNRTKKYILEEGKPVPFMVDLGVMTKEGAIVRQRYDKFKQINRFLEFIEDIIPQLPKGREITIIDFGCGKSYLTFAMYYYLKELCGFNIKVIGLDLKQDVIYECEELSRKYGYDKLHFYVGDIASYSDITSVDMVVTLHACDTATDYALAKAVSWGASVILSVPCCQHEANRTISNEMLAPVMDYGILKERMAAIITDAARAKLLEANGYQTQILEFIDMEHTPKNLLIRAVKQSQMKENTQSKMQSARHSALNMQKELNVSLTLSKLI
ncbi:MAG: class I SAM-dependent methyltransferase [Lachnospira sp.]